MFISLIFNIKWWTESKGCSIELSDFETPEITKCCLGDVKISSLLFQSCSSLTGSPLSSASEFPMDPFLQLGKNPRNSSFARVKVAEFGLPWFLGSMCWSAEQCLKGLSPPQHCWFGITLGNKLRNYTSFALQQEEGRRYSEYSDKFLNHSPAKIYN